MKYQLHWNSEDEGSLVFLEAGTEWLSLDIFIVWEEAEIVINHGIVVEELKKEEEISGKLLDKLAYCVEKMYSILLKKGIEEVFFVEKKKEPVIQALKEANIIEYAYSEYMMKRKFNSENILRENIFELEEKEDERSFVYENKENGFFCRLLPYKEKNSFYLYEVGVVEHLQNKGIATKGLLQLASDLVKKSEEGDVIFSLQVGSYNEPALHLYEKLGFEVFEEICYNIVKE